MRGKKKEAAAQVREVEPVSPDWLREAQHKGPTWAVRDLKGMRNYLAAKQRPRRPGLSPSPTVLTEIMEWHQSHVYGCQGQPEQGHAEGRRIVWVELRMYNSAHMHRVSPARLCLVLVDFFNRRTKGGLAVEHATKLHTCTQKGRRAGSLGQDSTSIRGTLWLRNPNSGRPRRRTLSTCTTATFGSFAIPCSHS